MYRPRLRVRPQDGQRDRATSFGEQVPLCVTKPDDLDFDDNFLAYCKKQWLQIEHKLDDGVLGVMASLLGTVFDDGVELILGADGAPKEGTVNFKKLVRSIAPVAAVACTRAASPRPHRVVVGVRVAPLTLPRVTRRGVSRQGPAREVRDSANRECKREQRGRAAGAGHWAQVQRDRRRRWSHHGRPPAVRLPRSALLSSASARNGGQGARGDAAVLQAASSTKFPSGTIAAAARATRFSFYVADVRATAKQRRTRARTRSPKSALHARVCALAEAEAASRRRRRATRARRRARPASRSPARPSAAGGTAGPRGPRPSGGRRRSSAAALARYAVVHTKRSSTTTSDEKLKIADICVLI